MIPAGPAPAPVVVVGSVNVDLLLRLPVLPIAGQTVTGGTHEHAPGGKGGNQAVAAARLGAEVHLIARVGDDPAAAGAVADLRAAGVGTARVLTTPGARTGLAAVLVDDASENLIGVSSGANHLLTAADVEAGLAALALEHAVMVLSLEIPLAAVAAAARAGHRLGWPVVLNPAPALPLPAGLLREVTVLTPNAHEVGRLGWRDRDDLLAAGVGAVVTTLGPAGAELARRGRPAARVAGIAVAAVDTTGAGDTFTGALARSLAAGADLPGAVRYANAAAALSTLGHGARAGMPTHAQVVDLLARR